MTEYVLISIALAMDCFSVSIATGIAARRVMWSHMTLMTLAFGVFQGGMTLIGYLGMNSMRHWIESVDHWIAFVLLSYLGFNMISTLWTEDDRQEFTPDILKMSHIPTMAVATSIDALAVGITFACVRSDIVTASLTIALGSSLFTVLGLCIGIMVGQRLKLPAEPIGGLVLIGIGIKILIEHLGIG